MSSGADGASPAAFRLLELRAPDGARAELYPYGAHVVSWTPAGERESRLYLSGATELRPGAAIRGGVPVIFPQFASEGPLPKHGFARVREWSVVAGPRVVEGAATATLSLVADERTRAVWPHDFAAELSVRVAGRSLEVALSVVSTGAEPIRFTSALHTYLRVDDVAQSRIEGLRGVTYRDSAAGGIERLDSDPLVPITGEIDRVYLDAPPRVEVREPHRTTRVEMLGFRDTVVWNPGAERASRLSDLDRGGERHMLCVEAATVRTPVVLSTGERWRGSQTLTAV